MADRLRSGIVGTGFSGAVHARAVRAAGGVVAAVASSSADGARSAASALLAERHEPSAESLICADDIDVVHICTPNSTHQHLAKAALAAGKHVICEKPLAMDLAGARELAAAAVDSEAVAAVPFVYRFYPMVRDARERVQLGEAGQLHLLHGCYLQDWLSSSEDNDWRVDPLQGGTSRAFADIGVHWCDLIEFVSGHRITRLSARMLTAHPSRRAAGEMVAARTEDVVTVQFETDGGALGNVVVSQVSQGRKNRLYLSLDGDKASIAFDQQAPDVLTIGSRQDLRIIERGTSSQLHAADAYSVLPPGHPQGYQEAFTAFVSDVYATVSGQAADVMPTFADGVRAAAITEAVLRSSAAQSWTEVGS